MSDQTHHHHVSRHLHRWVYGAIGGLGLWYVFSAWLGFAGTSQADYLLVIASLFIVIAIALPFAASRIGRMLQRNISKSEGEPFAEWAAGDLDTATGRVSGGTAIVEILLPIAAVAFGMTLFAIVAIALA